MKLQITDFGAEPNSRQDTSFPAFLAAEQLRAAGGGELIFEPGEYHFYQERALQHLCWISNHDSGLRYIGMPFFGLDGLKVVATGARFIFHGKMIPVWFGGCKNISWTGGTIDWEQPLHTEGRLLKNILYGMEIEILAPGAMRVQEGKAFLAGDGWEDELHDFILLDAQTKRVIPGTEDHFCNGWFEGQYRFESITASTFRIRFPNAPKVFPPDGTRLILQGGTRHCPGFVLDASDDIAIDRLTIRHSGSMAILGQNSGNIRIQNTEIAPDPNSSRYLAAGADATHFVNCFGDISLTDCTFQGMLDDATNVHGHYAPIDSILSDTELVIKHGHSQQRGFQFAAVGEQVAFVRRDSFRRIHESVVTSVKRLNDSHLILELDTPIPQSDCKLVLENLDRIPNLTMKGCHISGNRARGMLIATAGKVVIESNTIAAPGAGISIMPDCNLWFESGPTRDVTIRGNHFDQSLSSPGWGDAAIFIDPAISSEGDGKIDYLNKKIRIENNRFTLSESKRIIRAKSVQTLVFKNNEIETRSEETLETDTLYTIADCGEFVEEGNRFT